jgi:hypothetical protein
VQLHRFRPSAFSSRRAAAAAAGLLATVSLAACTSESGGSKEAELTGTTGAVQTAVDKFASAAKRDDAGGICRDLITPELRKQLTTSSGTCAQNVQNAIDHADYTALAVTKVTLGSGTPPTTALATTKLVESDTATRQVLLSAAPGGKTWLVGGFNVPKPSATTPATTPKS